MKYYSNSILAIFNDIQHAFIPAQHKYNFMGSAGDLNIGEYINLYFDIDINADNMLSSKVRKSTFSAIGSTMLIASAEYFCKMSEGLTLADILVKCDLSNGHMQELEVAANREHSFNFVLQAFYDVMQSISNYGCATS